MSTSLSPQQADLDALRDLLPALLIGTASPDEGARARDLLARCMSDSALAEQVRADARLIAMLDAALLEAVPPVAPPPRLKAALMARISAEASAGESAMPVTPAAPPPSAAAVVAPMRVVDRSASRRWMAVALTAAALLLVSNAIWWVTLNGTRADLDTARAAQGRALALVGDLGAQRVGLQSTSDSVIRLATLYYDRETAEAALVTDGLPPLAPDQTYQVWLIEDGQRQSVGLFAPDTSGIGLLIFSLGDVAALASDAALGISVEPAGGSQQPTTAPVAVASLAT